METDLPRIESRFLTIMFAGQAMEIQFSPNGSLTAGSERRARRAMRIVRSAFKRLKYREIRDHDEGITVQILHADDVSIQHMVATVDQKLGYLAQEFLTTKMVEEILGITSRERTRWSKDGRLPNSGRASFKRGQNRVSLFTYSPVAIADLTKHPELIANWREMDAMGVDSGANLNRAEVPE